jgi:phospholipid/cholesterol/gamma-HCH transport system permease protein
MLRDCLFNCWPLRLLAFVVLAWCATKCIFSGNYSLAIISVSGLFVGFVLGLQGYYTLQRYGLCLGFGFVGGAQFGARTGPCGQRLAVCGHGLARRLPPRLV